MNKDFFVEKRRQVSESMMDNSILVMFSGNAPHKSADSMYHYTPNRSFYYLTGLDKPNFILLVSKLNGEVKETLFIEKGDPVMEKWEGKRMNTEEAGCISGIKDISYTGDFVSGLNLLLNRSSFKNAYLNLEQLKWDMQTDASHKFAKELSEKHPYLEIRNIYHVLSEMRIIKSAEEIEEIKKAIDITDKGIASMMRNVRPGMYEYQLQAYFDFELRSAGVMEHAFPSIIASGINGATLHYEDNNCLIEDNSLILADLGAQYGYYCADITRTFPSNGKFTDRQKQVYNIVLRALEETTKAIKPGVPFVELNKITKRVLAEGCKEIGLIKEDSELSRYYYHGVSHYLGLDTHDVGSRDAVLAPGMVLTVEPGLYIEEEKIGIRIEDDILVTETGSENLSKQIIKTVEEIEAFMSRR
ncbi:MAG: aminopeptidase P family protein [Bacillota bacterium]